MARPFTGRARFISFSHPARRRGGRPGLLISKKRRREKALFKAPT